jgi:hypothetical protein
MNPTNIDLDQLLDQLLIARGIPSEMVRFPSYIKERKLAKDLVALVNSQTANEQLVVDTPENESLFDNDSKPDYQSAAYNNYEEEKEAAKLFKPAFKGDGTKEYGQKIIAAFNAVGIQNNGLTCCSENLYYFANQNNQIDLSTILPTDHTLEYL